MNSFRSFAGKSFRAITTAGECAVKPIGTADWPSPARRPCYTALDCGKFIRDFGITMPDWRKSLRPIVARVAS